eukprot:PhM_4_TR2239/c0_g1_i3/m.82573/K01745/hutH, HAL; histidine ammonia-lyase
MPKPIVIDGERMTPERLVKLGYEPVKMTLSASALQKVRDAREVVEDIVASNRVVYGINTGFGKFATVTVPKEKLVELQLNLIRSHAVGVGHHMSVPQSRMLLALGAVTVVDKGMDTVLRCVCVMGSVTVERCVWEWDSERSDWVVVAVRVLEIDGEADLLTDILCDGVEPGV